MSMQNKWTKTSVKEIDAIHGLDLHFESSFRDHSFFWRGHLSSPCMRITSVVTLVLNFSFVIFTGIITFKDKFTLWCKVFHLKSYLRISYNCD